MRKATVVGMSKYLEKLKIIKDQSDQITELTNRIDQLEWAQEADRAKKDTLSKDLCFSLDKQEKLKMMAHTLIDSI